MAWRTCLRRAQRPGVLLSLRVAAESVSIATIGDLMIESQVKLNAIAVNDDPRVTICRARLRGVGVRKSAAPVVRLKRWGLPLRAQPPLVQLRAPGLRLL